MVGFGVALIMHVDYRPSFLGNHCEHGRSFPRTEHWKGDCREPGYAWVLTGTQLFHVCSAHLLDWYANCSDEDYYELQLSIQEGFI